MNVLTRVEDNVIIWIADIINKVSNGYYVPSDETTILEVVGREEFKLHTVETVPGEVNAATHCYDGISFSVNGKYTKPPMTVSDLEKQIEVMQNAIDDLILGGMK